MINQIYRYADSRQELSQFMDQALAAWPYPYETNMIETRLGKTHVFTAGEKSKPALLLLHGAQSNLLSWGGDIPQYIADYYVVAPDIPGEAGKSDAVRLQWNNDDAVNWLNELLDGLGITVATIIGMSLGGYYAMRFAADFPQKVKKLVLIAPGGIVKPGIKLFITALKYSGKGMKDPEKARKMVFGDAQVHPMAVEFFMLTQKHMQPRIKPLPLIQDKTLRGIRAPMLFILGENDALFDAKKAARRIASVVPNAQTVTIPQGGHGLITQSGNIIKFLKEG